MAGHRLRGLSLSLVLTLGALGAPLSGPSGNPSQPFECGLWGARTRASGEQRGLRLLPFSVPNVT